MNTCHVAVVGLLLVGCAADAAPIRLGSTIRARLSVDNASPRPVQGKVTDVDSLGLRVVTGGTTPIHKDVWISWDEVLSIEVATRRSRRLLRGMGYGFLTGVVIGASIGLGAGDDQRDHNLGTLEFSAGEKAVGFGTLLGGVGLVVGGLVGLGDGRTEWQKGERPIEFGLHPSGDGVRLRVAHRF